MNNVCPHVLGQQIPATCATPQAGIDWFVIMRRFEKDEHTLA
jgi:hypothetical protein